MNLSQRIREVEAKTHLPNVTPLRDRPVRRAVPRWIEWTRENEQDGSKDLTGREAA